MPKAFEMTDKKLDGIIKPLILFQIELTEANTDIGQFGREVDATALARLLTGNL
jgi:hypothetical protein